MKVLIAIILCLALSQVKTVLGIVGGGDIPIASAPYQAVIHYFQSETPELLCGGVIISPQWILTCGDCVNFRNATYIKVRVGSNLLNTGGNLHSATQKIVHPQFNTPTSIYQDYNIALVKLYTPITLVQSVKEVANLPGANDIIVAGTDVYISGWGLTTAASKEPSGTLQGANILTTVQIECVWAYCNVMEITPRMVCASNPGIYSCRYDEGGPMLRVSDGLLIGILAPGLGLCGNPNYHAIYTRVASVRDWITQNTGV